MGNTSGKTAPRSRSNKKTVHWKAADKPFPPGRPQLVAGPPNLDPDVVTLRWDRPISDGGSPIIGYVVEHKRTGSPHWVRATPGLVGKCELSMSGLEPGWRYQFRVIAHNAVDASEPSELSEPLTVTLQRNIIIAPRFTTQLQDTTALENEKVEFLVQMSGIPTPTVSWYKDGFEIFSSRRTRILTENGQSLLIIYQTSLVDEGEIKCTATNKAGHVTTKANLKVEAPPRIRLPKNYEDGLLFELDEMIRLKVSVAGKPAPEIFWSHNGESIANDPRYEVINVDKTSAVKVKNAKRVDRGEYQVRAVNKLGEHTATFLVTVTDRPTPPGKVTVMSLGKSATLTWSAPEDDGGCKIGNYIIEYYRVGWNVWLKAGTSRKLSTTLGDLIEGSEYRFRIKAENPYGMSDPSEESETIFIPDPKRGLLQPPPRSKSMPREVLENVEDVKPPKIQKTSMSVASSKSSLNSRPTSPSPNEPVRPSRGNKMKTPSITPDPSPIARRRDIPINNPIPNNYFDRSSVVRELSYGTTTKPVKREVINKSPEITIQNDSKIEAMALPPKINNNIIQPIFNEQNPKINTTLESPRNDDILHGSSEFMLVLLPNNNKSANNRKGGSISNINIEFSEGVAPPMSLSAPELGFEPPFLGSLRYAVSSSELLHERAMMRFYEATQNEQAETMSNTSQLKLQPKEYDTISIGSRRQSTEIPTIKIESDELELLERKHSLRRRLSGSGISQQMLWQRRLSWNAQQKAQTISEQSSSAENLKEVKIHEEKLQVNQGRLKAPMIRQRSESEEMEEQLFEQVRAKMTKQNSQEEKKKIDIAPEDKWEEEEVIETEEPEEDIEDEESSDDDRPWLREEEHTEIIAPQEEETYHPRLMISQPVVPNKSDPTDVPFEILNKPTPLPDPNFIPKPILKKKDNSDELSKKNIPDKPQRKNIPTKETGLLKNIAGSLSHLRIKKSSKDKSKDDVKPQPTIIITAAEAAQMKRAESRKNSLEETRVAIDHYTDIVREYGQVKKPQKPLYLNTEALKKAAESQNDGDETNSEVSSVSSRPISPVSKLSQYSSSNSVDKSLYKNQSSEESITAKLKPIRKPIESSEESINNKFKQPSRRQINEELLTRKPKQLRKQIDSSEESISTKLKRKPIESSEESISTKLRRKPIESSEESLTTRLQRNSLNRKLKNPLELSKQPPNNTSQIRPLKLKDTQPKETYSPPASTSKSIQREKQTSVDKLEQDQLIQAEIKVRSTVNYLTDVAMFIVACWLYLFHDARLAIPILILMVYRQLSDELSPYIPSWLKQKKNT
ncbi:protein slender lobes [Chrysoperla carnea]|uniref:protein slender lobes n=1 Tax=Chrysoperla carnea TaxID=189513 RepID=UPI001D07998C|nr:protein slender lobes [Chrysoperla carnea]